MKRKKLQENSPDPTGDTERGWMWKIHCPSCNDPRRTGHAGLRHEENANASTGERRKQRADR